MSTACAAVLIANQASARGAHEGEAVAREMRVQEREQRRSLRLIKIMDVAVESCIVAPDDHRDRIGPNGPPVRDVDAGTQRCERRRRGVEPEIGEQRGVEIEFRHRRRKRCDPRKRRFVRQRFGGKRQEAGTTSVIRNAMRAQRGANSGVPSR